MKATLLAAIIFLIFTFNRAVWYRFCLPILWWKCISLFSYWLKHKVKHTRKCPKNTSRRNVYHRIIRPDSRHFNIPTKKLYTNTSTVFQTNWKYVIIPLALMGKIFPDNIVVMTVTKLHYPLFSNAIQTIWITARLCGIIGHSYAF